MLRNLAVILAVALSACSASPRPDSAAVVRTASHQAMQELPRPEPLPLTAVDPPVRLQSELERLSPAETARWIFPGAASSTIAGRELLRGFTAQVNAIALYPPARPAPFPGICVLRGYEVWLRVPNESSLTSQQHLDPPLQPYQYREFERWRVAGSTTSGSPLPDCAAATYLAFFEAPSGDFVHRAVRILEQAQRGAVRPRLHCQQMRYEEARSDFGYPQCADARALLSQLTPNLIRRVRPADCVLSSEPRGCLGVEYDDPAAPGTHSIYVVTIPDTDRPAYIQIAQMMLPPS